MKKAFTLLEMIIVLIIISVLSGCIIQSYLTISGIAFRIDQKKNLTEEALSITQIIDTIASDATIDYTKYCTKQNCSDLADLADVNWYADVLYLTGELWSGASIYTTWTCLPLEWWGEYNDGERWNFDMYNYSGCNLILEQNGIKTPLIATNNDDFKKIIVSKAKFRIIPFHSNERYYDNGDVNITNNLWKPSFRLFIHFYSPYYQSIWKNQIDQPLQLFFNLNAPVPDPFS